MTDTSTQAVEAHAKTLDGRSSEFWKYAALLRALAAERDEFVEMVRDLRIETGQLWNDIASARRTALEDAAKVAGPLPLADNSDYEKQAHDLRCVIASEIRALIETTNEEK